MSEDQRKIIIEKLMKENEDNSYDSEFGEETAYRRGYHQGFHNARNRPDVTVEMVHEWRYSQEDAPKAHPPGSPFDGSKKLEKKNGDNLGDST